MAWAVKSWRVVKMSAAVWKDRALIWHRGGANKFEDRNHSNGLISWLVVGEDD